MKTMKYLLFAIALFLTQVGCVGSVQMASRGERISIWDNRPRLSITINATDADLFDVTDDRNFTHGIGIKTGSSVIIPIMTGNRNNRERRTFFVKGYRRMAGDSTKLEYIGFSCRRVFAGMNQQPQPWIIDALVRPGDRGSSCH